MTPFRPTLVAACILLFASAPAAAQRLYIVGVPSETDAEMGKRILAATLALVLKANDGDRIQVFDALNLQKVADLTIPSNAGSSNAKIRVVRLKEQIVDLKTYFNRAASVRSGKAMEIKVPQFLELAGATIKASSGDTTVLLCGSPYYLDARDAAFVFGQGYYPSDGHILATSKRSVFGTADKQNLLKGATVHFCHLDDIFETELERTAVRRFWKLYTDRLGAVLATFTPSTDVAVERCVSNVTDPVSQDELIPEDRVIEMRKTVISTNRQADSSHAPSRETLRNESPPQPAEVGRTTQNLNVDRRVEDILRSVPRPKPGSLVIAAAWVTEGDARTADVDLHVRAHRDSEEVNFVHRSSRDATYLRDIRAANNSLHDEDWGASWEAVEISGGRIEDTTCWLDLYEGCGGKIEGVVRVVFEDRSADVPFSFPAIDGDHASNREKREGNPCWIEIGLNDLAWTRTR